MSLDPDGRSQGGGPESGLDSLHAVVLDDANAEKLRRAVAVCSGDPAWRTRKAQEARDILALSQIAPPGRVEVEWLDLRESLRAVVRLGAPVPVWDESRKDIIVKSGVVLGLSYIRDALSRPLPGSAFLLALAPKGIWLPNVGLHPEQPVCLGVTLPAGVRARYLLLLAYNVFCMADLQVDEFDTAGVFNPVAARWWQRHLEKTPLSRLALLEPASPAGAAPREEVRS